MPMPKLDAKFYGQIRKAKDDTVVPEDEYMVFLAKDNAFAEILPKYIEVCKRRGCDQEQIASIERGLDRLNKWRAANAERCKDPDAKGEKLLG